MIDPREEVKAAVEKCHTAGITVKMLTGDQTTAAAIGTEFKIISQKGSMSGEDLDHIDSSKLTEAFQTSIYARVARAQTETCFSTSGEVKW